MEMLYFYGIKLADTIQMKLDNYVILPENSSTATSSELCAKLSQLNRKFDLEPKMTPTLRKNMSFKLLTKLDSDLRDYLNPISMELDFLVYFHLHNCKIFIKYLKSEVNRLLSFNSSIEELAVSVPLLSPSKRLSTVDPREKLEQVKLTIL